MGFTIDNELKDCNEEIDIFEYFNFIETHKLTQHSIWDPPKAQVKAQAYTQRTEERDKAQGWSASSTSITAKQGKKENKTQKEEDREQTNRTKEEVRQEQLKTN